MKPRRDQAERFWEKVDKSGDCWLWTAVTTPKGYGYFTTTDGPKPKNRGAHRVAYELAVGPIPEGLQLDHLCRVRNCVNPEHLEPVTPGENVRRGQSAQTHRARMLSRTHCKNGHEYTPESTYMHPQMGRVCRICRRGWTKAYYMRKREAAS